MRLIPTMKLGEFQHYLLTEQIDLAFFVHPDISITYFTQFSASFAYFLVFPKQAILYLTTLDRKPKIRGVSVEELRTGWEKKVGINPVKKIGINKEVLSLAFFEKLQKLYPQAVFVDVSLKLKELRRQKTEEEIHSIQTACQITSEAFDKLIDALPNLATEAHAAAYLENYFKEKGAEAAFPTIAATGKNGATPHHQTSTQKLCRGPLQLDFGAKYSHYCADMSRVVFLGTAVKQEKERYDLLLEVQLAAIDYVKEKRLFSELHSFAQQRLGKYNKYFIHSLGHGIGLEVHEAPRFSLEAKEIIMKHEPFTIEPGVYFPGKFGLRIEDTVYVDNNGKVKILTTANKELTCVKR